jgi:hypothetical protein
MIWGNASPLAAQRTEIAAKDAVPIMRNASPTQRRMGRR